MSEDIQKELERLQQEEADAKEKLENLGQLSAAYPDLRTFKGRWEKKVYCAKSANASVTGCDIRHNCGCCHDSPLEVWPYLETEHGKVYSDPPRFMVGEKESYDFDRPYDGWKSDMEETGISAEVVSLVQEYFLRQRRSRREELEAELAELEEGSQE